MTDNRDIFNRLRVDLYRRLLPRIQRVDQESGAQGFDIHWDDPAAVWDSALDASVAISTSWDNVGLAPFYQELFYVIEQMQGEELEVLESLEALTDPLRCPENLLSDLAASFGYRLDDSISEDKKRIVVLNLQQSFKSIGQWVGFRVFFRMTGFSLLNVFPLFKKDIFEENGDYSRVKYRTEPLAAQPVGPIGVQSFRGTFSQVPIKPGTVRFTDGTVVVRSKEDGTLIGPTTESGTINHETGEFVLNLAAPSAAAVTASYDRILEEWPYDAARIDVEITMTPMGAPSPVVDGTLADGIIARLDEIRPIHVVLRALALVFELDDEFSPGATDQEACAQLLKLVVDPVPSIPGDTGSNSSFMIDDGVRGEDELRIEQITGGNVTDTEQAFDDTAPIVCPVDILSIDTGGAVPAADTLW